jgi:DNA-directed RNA polymerase specialized sigma24 family protein
MVITGFTMVAITETQHYVRTAAAREKLFMELYENAFPMVAKFVSQRQGTLQDAKDIFQDSLVIFYEKLAAGNVLVNVSDEAYVLGIAKHLWIRKFSRERPMVSLSEFESEITIPNDYFPAVETNKLIHFLEVTGKKCMAMLRAFYYDKHSMNEIARDFGYRTLHSATVQKFKCLEKIRDKVKEKSILYEDFIE